MDRSGGYNSAGGPVFTEIRSAMFDMEKKPKLINYVYGLGGREITLNDIKGVYDVLAGIAKTGKLGSVYNFLGVRGI